MKRALPLLLLWALLACGQDEPPAAPPAPPARDPSIPSRPASLLPTDREPSAQWTAEAHPPIALLDDVVVHGSEEGFVARDRTGQVRWRHRATRGHGLHTVAGAIGLTDRDSTRWVGPDGSLIHSQPHDRPREGGGTDSLVSWNGETAEVGVRIRGPEPGCRAELFDRRTAAPWRPLVSFAADRGRCWGFSIVRLGEGHRAVVLADQLHHLDGGRRTDVSVGANAFHAGFAHRGLVVSPTGAVYVDESLAVRRIPIAPGPELTVQETDHGVLVQGRDRWILLGSDLRVRWARDADAGDAFFASAASVDPRAFSPATPLVTIAPSGEVVSRWTPEDDVDAYVVPEGVIAYGPGFLRRHRRDGALEWEWAIREHADVRVLGNAIAVGEYTDSRVTLVRVDDGRCLGDLVRPRLSFVGWLGETTILRWRGQLAGFSARRSSMGVALPVPP